MTNKKISDLPAASALTGNELLLISQSGSSRKSLLSAIKTFILSEVAAMLGTFVPVLVMARSAVAAACPANTTENILATIFVPGGAMGANGQLRVTTLWTYTNSTNAKTLRVRFGGSTGTAYLTNVTGSTATVQTQAIIRNRGSASSQVGYASATTATFGASTASVATSAVNTESETTIVITGQKTTAAETLTLESYLVELIK